MSDEKGDKLQERFSEVFTKNLWKDSESVSGPGSRKDSKLVKLAIEALNLTNKRYNIRNLVDVPCGDFNWMYSFLRDNPKIRYAGFDIVPSLVSLNSQRYSNYKFNVFDITKEVPPRCDLLFSKELLLHLQTSDVFLALANMKRSKSKYLMLLNNFGSVNTELPDDGPGSCRSVDVCAPPYSYPPPLWRNELYGLWRIDNLPDFFGSTFLERLLRKPARNLASK